MELNELDAFLIDLGYTKTNHSTFISYHKNEKTGYEGWDEDVFTCIEVDISSGQIEYSDYYDGEFYKESHWTYNLSLLTIENGNLYVKDILLSKE